MKEKVKERQIENPRYFLAALLFGAYLVVTGFFMEGVAVLDPGVTNTLSDLEFYLFFVASIALAAALFFVSKKYFGVRFSWPWFAFLLTLTVIDAMALICFPDHIESTTSLGSPGTLLVLDMTNAMRVRFFFWWVAAAVGIYVFMVVAPKLFYGHRSFDFFVAAGMWVGVGLILVSYFTDAEIYKTIFTVSPENATDVLRNYRPSSICNNNNTFGFAVFFSLMCTLYLHSRRRGVYHFVIALYLMLSMILTGSKTCIALATMVSIIYVVWASITGWKKRRKTCLALIISVACVLVILVGLYFLPVPALKPLQDVIHESLKMMAGGADSGFTGRSAIWEALWAQLKSNWKFLAFGTGDRAWELFVGLYEYRYPDGCSHNGFLMVLGRFGFVGLLAYAALIAYLVYSIFRGVTKYKQKWLLCLFFILLGFLAHGMWEDTCLLDFRLKGIMMLGLIGIPPLMAKHQFESQKEAVVDEEKAAIETTNGTKVSFSPVDVLRIAFFAATPLFVFFVGCAPLIQSIFGSCSFANGNSLGVFTATYLAMPLLLALAKVYKDRGRKSVWISILATSGAVALAGIVVAFVAPSLVFTIIYAVLMAAGIVLALIFTKGALFNKEALFVLVLFVLLGLVFVAIGHGVGFTGVVAADNRMALVAFWVLFAVVYFCATLIPFKNDLSLRCFARPLQELETKYLIWSKKRLDKANRIIEQNL